MATYGSALRQGLPRTPGGDPWPPAGDAPEQASAALPTTAAAPAASGTEAAPASPAPEAPIESAPVSQTADAAHADPAKVTLEQAAGVSDAVAPAASGAVLRRGLPRTPGGEPWPSAGVAAVSVSTVTPPASSRDAAEVPVSHVADPAGADRATVTLEQGVKGDAAEDGPALRRGLPRVAGGEPWPPADAVARIAVLPTIAVPPAEDLAPVSQTADAAVEHRAEATPEQSVAEATPERSTPPAASETSTAVATQAGPLEPLPFRPTVTAGRYASVRPAPKPEPARIGPFTRVQWAGAAVVGGIGLLFAAALAVLFVRALNSMDFMQDFFAAFPGEYHLPDDAPVGFPAWLGWQHFFNFFLMVLIIRSGLTVRTEKRPTAFWAPRRDSTGKVSLTIWFHQSLDVLWLVNGLVFVVLLFVSGQWMRVIPTSWEVFPNALSAALQYVSLNWPTENGWVNYNSLQQIAYFTTIFIAAPLAAVTGYRMSGMWPRNAKALNRIYPIEWARAVHFPVMLYFVVFIFIHVALVLSTGALRNLNHMYAAQGSVNGVQYADNWTGFWLFVASLVVIAAAWIAARPLVLAPIARLFGTVSSR